MIAQLYNKFMYAENLSNVRNQGTTQTRSKSSIKGHIKETKTPKNLEHMVDSYGYTHYSLLPSDDKYKVWTKSPETLFYLSAIYSKW